MRRALLALMFAVPGVALECVDVPPCGRIDNSSLFFLGRVSAEPSPVPLGPVPPPPSPDGSSDPPYTVPLEVIEPLLGTIEPTRVLLEIRGKWMKTGEVWLVNAMRGSDGMLRPLTCGHTVPQHSEDPVLQFLRDRVAKARQGVTQHGMIRARVTADLHTLNDASVTIVGPVVRQATSNENGLAVFPEIPPGTYTGSAIKPGFTQSTDRSLARVQLLPGACPSLYILLNKTGK